MVSTVFERAASEPERVDILVFIVAICPERAAIFPVAVARFVFVVARLLLVVAKFPDNETILPVARARSVRIPRIVPERAFCARVLVK